MAGGFIVLTGVIRVGIFASPPSCGGNFWRLEMMERSAEASPCLEGRVEGSIALPGQTITVGRTGQTEALLIANEIVVLGQVRGNCQANDHLDIRSEGSMSGDAIVSRISIADGAFVKGKIDVRRS